MELEYFLLSHEIILGPVRPKINTKSIPAFLDFTNRLALSAVVRFLQYRIPDIE